MELTGEAVTFLLVFAGILGALGAGLLYLERRQNRNDELAEFRRVIDAMRRLEDTETDR